jgi:LacI family transcriptional regulator
MQKPTIKDIAKALSISPSTVSDIKNTYFLDFLKGRGSIFFQRGYKFILTDSGENVEKEKNYLM